MEACGWRLFLAGAAAATAMVSLVLMVIVLYYYAPIYSEAQEARSAIAAASRLIAELNKSNIPEALDKLSQTLVRLNQSLRLYDSLYSELQWYREIIELVYNETHSPDFNKTLENLMREAETLRLLQSLLGSALSETLYTMESLLRSLRHISELAHEALMLADSLPPQEAKKLVWDAERLLEVARDPALQRLLTEAPMLLAEANKTLAELPRPQPLAACAAAVGVAAAAAAIYLLHSCGHREDGESPRGSAEDASPKDGL